MWRPVEGAKRVPHVGAPSSFKQAMETAFGTMPIRLSDAHIDKLTAMAAVAGGGNEDNPYSALIDILERVDGPIEVWAEY